MSQPVLLGDLMKDYLINSADDYAQAYRDLFKDHGKDILKLWEDDSDAQ